MFLLLLGQQPAAAGALATSDIWLFPAASGAAALASFSSVLACGGGGTYARACVTDSDASLRDVPAFQCARWRAESAWEWDGNARV